MANALHEKILELLRERKAFDKFHSVKTERIVEVVGGKKSMVANELVRLQGEGMVKKFIPPAAKRSMWYLTPKGAQKPEEEEDSGYMFH